MKIKRKTYSLLARRSCLVKVFRFQRKTFLLIYWVFFSLYYSHDFSYGFCAEDFSEMLRPIFMKFSGLIDKNKNLIYFFLFWFRHFRFWEIAIFLVFRGSRCPDFFSETITDRKLKFSAFIENILSTPWFNFQFCRSKGTEARLGLKNRRKYFDKIFKHFDS